MFKHPITVIVKLLLSAQIKSAKTSNLISLRTLLILEICLLDKTMNLLKLPKLIGTIICFLDRPFVIIVVATTRRNGTRSMLTSAKLSNWLSSSGDYKRTRQGASFLIKVLFIQMVHGPCY